MAEKELNYLLCMIVIQYGDSAGNTVEENGCIFSLIRMR